MFLVHTVLNAFPLSNIFFSAYIVLLIYIQCEKILIYIYFRSEKCFYNYIKEFFFIHDALSLLVQQNTRLRFQEIFISAYFFLFCFHDNIITVVQQKLSFTYMNKTIGCQSKANTYICNKKLFQGDAKECVMQSN